MAARELNLESVLNFMLEAGGKCTNKELITDFKTLLDDPVNRAKNREKFKEFVNTLSYVKDDKNGNKYLILKKQYRSKKSHGGNKTPNSEPVTKDVTSPMSSENRENDFNTEVLSPKDLSMMVAHESKEIDCNTPRKTQRAKSEPPSMQQLPNIEIAIEEPQLIKDESIPKSQSENDLQQSNSMKSLAEDSTTPSTSSVVSTASEKDMIDNALPSGIRSVKDQARHLNKLQSESDLLKLSSRKSDKKFDKNKDGTDDDDMGSSFTFVTLSPEQKEWMIQAAKCDYQELSKLLSKNPLLAKEKTALHWAAKHGKPDVIKLLCGKAGVNVDQRTGYTPLHLASIQCHDDVIELLIQTYKANPNLRDHCGKKPKQYLSSSASARCQQLLQIRAIEPSLDENFERSEAIRKSKRVAAVGNLINSSNSMKVQPYLRSSWGGSCEDIFGGQLSSQSTSPSSSIESSPCTERKNLGASSLMPPPIAPVRKKKQRSKTMYSSKENLNNDFPGVLLKRKGSDSSINSSSYI
ncbi:ankyrin repeat domain-containing protein SOWAHB-like isoform X1 [Argonauta hians]